MTAPAVLAQQWADIQEQLAEAEFRRDQAATIVDGLQRQRNALSTQLLGSINYHSHTPLFAVSRRRVVAIDHAGLIKLLPLEEPT